MNTRSLPLLAALLGVAATAVAGTVDIPIGFVPQASVVEGVRKTLSPQGKFVILTANGVVRVTDTEEKILEVHRVLGELAKAPAVVSLNLGFITYGTKTVQVPSTGSGGGGDEFLFPRKFSPPKMVQGPNGTVVAVPSQPSQFSGRGAGATAGATVMTTKTEPTKQLVRSLTATSTPEKPAPIPVLAKVEDVAGLRALAEKLGAVNAQEPAWTAASTELLLRTQVVGAELRVLVTPQIALPAAAPGQQPRRIPLKACAAEISITRAVPSPTGKLPRADAEFYRLFMGLAPGAPTDTTALNLTGAVRYIGTPVAAAPAPK
ncbi:MAG TPA: hypothetical protein VGO11_04705 [Chthoniobacteraceae bacterium]|jgi:hypothetical protein|nr:hypothetical protein [Chthoniobacteraceae bacterium]